eukprot:3495851-Pyramimonas_sp.AAC.1
MFGDRNPELNLHGSGTTDFLELRVEVVLPRYGEQIKNLRAWTDGLTSMRRVLGIIRNRKGRMTIQLVQGFEHCVLTHMRQCRLIGLNGILQHHFLLEMAAGLVNFGPPFWCSCWRSEGLNR